MWQCESRSAKFQRQMSVYSIIPSPSYLCGSPSHLCTFAQLPSHHRIFAFATSHSRSLALRNTIHNCETQIIFSSNRQGTHRVKLCSILPQPPDKDRLRFEKKLAADNSSHKPGISSYEIKGTILLRFLKIQTLSTTFKTINNRP